MNTHLLDPLLADNDLLQPGVLAVLLLDALDLCQEAALVPGPLALADALADPGPPAGERPVDHLVVVGLLGLALLHLEVAGHVLAAKGAVHEGGVADAEGHVGLRVRV